MGLLGFGKRAEAILAVVTYEGPGRFRLNGVRGKGAQAKKGASAHDRTVCWVEFDSGGIPVDRGLGRAATQAGQAERLLRDLPTNPICRTIIDRLRQGEESVGKWLQVGEAVPNRGS